MVSEADLIQIILLCMEAQNSPKSGYAYDCERTPGVQVKHFERFRNIYKFPYAKNFSKTAFHAGCRK